MTDAIGADVFDYLAKSEHFRVLLLHGSQSSPGVRYVAGRLYGERGFVGGMPVVRVWGTRDHVAPRVVDAVTARELSQGPIGHGRGTPGVDPVAGEHADYRVRLDGERDA